MSEAQLQQMVIDLARWLGFLHFHDNDPRRNRAGFPDLVLLHTVTGRLIFVELKSEKGRLRPEQDTWMSKLGIHHEAYVWRPAHWNDGVIRQILSERAVNAA
jgi:hypothetical protein